MVRLCNYGTALIFNVHIGFLTFQDHLYLSYQTGTPCICRRDVAGRRAYVSVLFGLSDISIS